jgi:hypothetical protein
MIRDFYEKLSKDAKRGVIAVSSLLVIVLILLVIFLIIVPATSKGKGGKPSLGINRPSADPLPGSESYGMTQDEQCKQCTPMVDDIVLEESETEEGVFRVYDGYDPATDDPVECKTPWSGLPKSHSGYKGDVSNCTVKCSPGVVSNRCKESDMQALRENAKEMRFKANGLPL